MLSHTFCHIPTVGVKTEEKLWKAGIRTWDDLLALSEVMDAEQGQLPVKPERLQQFKEHIVQSRLCLSSGDTTFFADRLPPQEHWRLYKECRGRIAYMDIESTGTGPPNDHITTIAVWDGSRVQHYVWGRNLEEFLDDILEYEMLVTFNGKCFDVPFIEKQLQTKINLPHIDLRFALTNVGVGGGLKKVEKKFGLDRGDLDGVDGYWAVLLWKEFMNTRNEAALETLLAYNVEDVLSLEVLAAIAYNLHVDQTPFSEIDRVPVPGLGSNPFTPNKKVLRKIKYRYFRRSGS